MMETDLIWYNYGVLLCNGSTRDFGSLSLGSNPGRTTMQIQIRLWCKGNTQAD